MSRPRMALALGGVHVAHVLADADVPAAASHIVNGAFGYAGQKCTATQVIAADERVVDELRAELKRSAEGLKVGGPLDAAAVVDR